MISSEIAIWIGSLSTLGAFIVTFTQIKIELTSRIKREKQEFKQIELYQASKISGWLHIGNSIPNCTSFIIHNGSELPIYNVVASLVIYSGSGPHSSEEVRSLEKKAGNYLYLRKASSSVPPGSRIVSFENSWGGMSRKPGIEIAFTDTNGIHWIRRHNGKLDKIPVDPIRFLEVPVPYSDSF
ncbi:hypothetical protein HW450_10970 [Corynebacterium hindlerae]|uniref:Uncharacterized protein n=1 Tax=Corynebacterium hindlerae TaxID=699041 RepID=A0A7G5FE06_9CORY|nr:hypothetical protein [Corynebacterium hindlerae]QMV84847.1 hypothetical protein HW450_10970 [Corynebacterium hindlerae]